MLLTAETEIRIYEFLGVKFFRKMVFQLERLIHRRDKERNENYHIKSSNLNDIKDFNKYLFYNGSIHVRNVIFFFIYCLIKLIFGFRLRGYDAILLLLAIKDCYCIMLQRWNFLRIKLRLNRLTARKKQQLEKYAETFSKSLEEANYPRQKAAELLMAVEALSAKFKSDELVIISDEEAKIIKELNSILNRGL